MNIAKELGSLITGLLTAQTASPAPRTGKSQFQSSRTGTRNAADSGTGDATSQLNDRVTLSSASLAMADSAQNPARTTDRETVVANQGRPGKFLALPYLSSPDSTLPQQPDSESPITRQLVRDVYGSPSPLNTRTGPATSRNIDFHA